MCAATACDREIILIERWQASCEIYSKGEHAVRSSLRLNGFYSIKRKIYGCDKSKRKSTRRVRFISPALGTFQASYLI